MVMVKRLWYKRLWCRAVRPPAVASRVACGMWLPRAGLLLVRRGGPVDWSQDAGAVTCTLE